MFIHIGNNNTIAESEIIAILDSKTVNNSEVNKEFIDNLIEDGFLLNSDTEDIKTYIIVGNGIYTSNISSTALYRRSKL